MTRDELEAALADAEERGRREIARRISNDVDYAFRGLSAARDALSRPESRFPPVEDGENAIYRVRKTLDALLGTKEAGDEVG